MKDQYFGDIGDYKKFSLLKVLTTDCSINTCVCWMKTENDSSNDGRFIGYLKKPSLWRDYDVDIYDLLRKSVIYNNRRELEIFENSKLIKNCSFFSEILVDEDERRTKFFKNLWFNNIDKDLIFFDPDNGIEVKSIPSGKRGSKKYVYWNELKSTYDRGYGLLVYQHFPRVERDTYIKELVFKISEKLESNFVFGIRTKHAAFFLVPKKDQLDLFYKSMELYSDIWRDKVKISFLKHDKYYFLSNPSENQLKIF